MAQSLSKILVHIVYSTKYREPVLDPIVRPRLHAYMAAVVRSMGCECYRAGGVADHVHLAVELSRTITVAELVEAVKTSSSKWLKTQTRELASFRWQRGYAAFSIRPNGLDTVIHYIATQEEHHRARSFQKEHRSLLSRNDIAFDERYVWD